MQQGEVQQVEGQQVEKQGKDNVQMGEKVISDGEDDDDDYCSVVANAMITTVLAACGLPISGNKGVLQARLMEAMRNN